MPYRSKAQSAYIHAAASRGEGWAQKFVRDAHGSHVPNVRHVKKRKHKKVKRGAV